MRVSVKLPARVAGLCFAMASALACTVPQPDRESSGGQEASSESSEASTTSETGAAASCGWDAANAYNACGFGGAEPSGSVVRECGREYVVGEACPDALLVGCCDAEDSLWFCQSIRGSAPIVAQDLCGQS